MAGNNFLCWVRLLQDPLGSTPVWPQPKTYLIALYFHIGNLKLDIESIFLT